MMNIEIHFDKIAKNEIIVKHDAKNLTFDINDNILTTSIVEKTSPSLLEIYTIKLVNIKMLKFDDYFIIEPTPQTNYYKFEISYPFIKKYSDSLFGTNWSI